MKKVKLGEICDVRDGTHDSPTYIETGYPLVTSKNIVDSKLDLSAVNYISLNDYKKINERSKVDSGDIIMPMIGTIGNPYLVGEFTEFAIKNVALIKFNREQINNKYIFYFLNSEKFKKYIVENNRGGTQKFLSLKDIRNMEINFVSLEEQKEIVDRLDKVSSLIEKRKTQFEKLDQLIKSRFIEMFGAPTITDKNKSYKPMTSICEIIDGDRGKNYPKQEEFYENGYCLFLNAKNVTSNGFDFTNCMFITKDKDELLRKGKLNRGDVVLTTRGTIGNLAYYSDDVLFDNVRINSGMVILRMNHEVIDEIFFIEQFKLQLAEIKEKIASGSAQPQLPISTMNKIQMLVPKISKQIDFANFAEQIDKSKLAIQKSIDKLETLKKSLMQQYFG
ncbi:MAG: restriction endonuclease subunit S [Clostridia bacterium]|nr:restriction endonuclease subunit S [Clostridia bacterium]